MEDSNPNDNNTLSDYEATDSEVGVRNQPRQLWQQALARLKKRRELQQVEWRLQLQVHSEVLAKANQQVMAQKMQDYLQSGDPILMKEALNWLTQQETHPSWFLSLIKCVDVTVDERSEVLVEVFQALLRLQWSPAAVRRSLQETFGRGAIAELSFDDLYQWSIQLGQLIQRGVGAIEITDTTRLSEMPWD